MLFQIAEVESATSTNDLIKEAIDEGAPEGCAYRAKIQTGGYGRYGRAWASPEGGLYMSILLRPDEHAQTPDQKRALMADSPTLSLLTAIAVKNAIAEQLGELGCGCVESSAIRIKWPNDIVVDKSVAELLPTFEQLKSIPDFFKMVGISAEKHHDGICIGIGVNVLRPASTERAKELGSEDAKGMTNSEQSMRNMPVYIEDFSVDADDSTIGSLAKIVLQEFEGCYLKWLEQGFDPFAKEFDASSILNDQYVRIEKQDGETEVEGIVTGVDRYGRLLVRPEGQKEPVAVVSGEAHVNLEA